MGLLFDFNPIILEIKFVIYIYLKLNYHFRNQHLDSFKFIIMEICTSRDILQVKKPTNVPHVNTRDCLKVQTKFDKLPESWKLDIKREILWICKQKRTNWKVSYPTN